MPKGKEVTVISLGGSLIVPDRIDPVFLKKFRDVIRRHIKKGRRFIIICGGGKTAREYQSAAEKLTRLTRDDLDWLGIHATRMNAHLLRTIFRSHAHPRIITDPHSSIPRTYPIVIGAGWRPGWSTDYDAVIMAEGCGAGIIINLSNIKYVYDKDPRKYKSARRLLKLTWKEFRKLFGAEWHPGLNSPFDPIASKRAERKGLKVIIADGRDMKNLDRILDGKDFKGTVIC